MHQRRGAEWGCLAVVLLANCSKGPEEDPPKQALAWRSSSEAQGLRAGGAVGTDCTAGGERSCHTGVCAHVLAEYDRGYFCSAACQSDKHCPLDWTCRPMLPGRDDLGICFPPPGWTARELDLQAVFRPVARPWRIVDDPGLSASPDGGARGGSFSELVDGGLQ